MSFLTVTLFMSAMCAVSAAPVTKAGNPPARFVLNASHMGYSLPNGWELTIHETGHGYVKTWKWPEGPASLSVQLSPQQLRDLLAAVLASHLATMRDYYGALPVDGPYRSISLTQNGKTVHVQVYSLWAEEFPAEQRQDIERFIRLWSVVRGIINLSPDEAVDERPADGAFIKELAAGKKNPK